MKLRTSHGTYVFVGQDGGLRHLLEAPDRDFTPVWDKAPPPVLASVLKEAAVTEGPLAPSTLIVLEDNLVAFRREGLYLCADPTLSELRFDRKHIGEWESFAIEAADGAEFHYGSTELLVQSPNISRPVLIETLTGYQIMNNADDALLVTVTWPEFWKDTINRYALPDGGWIFDVDSTSDPSAPFLVYWFYPFSAQIYAWRLDRSGCRVAAYKLSISKARSFLLSRRMLGPAVTVRLYMLSHLFSDGGAAALLNAELCAAAEAGSTEALVAILRHPYSLPPSVIRGLAARAFNLLRAANRAQTAEVEAHINRLTANALFEALTALDPTLRGVSPEQFQSEVDFQEVFANRKQFPQSSTVPLVTLHRHTEQGLASILGGVATHLTIGILLRTRTRTLEFHYAHSTSIRHRVMDGLRYAYHAFCMNQADMWERLSTLGPAAETWMIRFEVGDLPSQQRPSVSFERLLGDTSVSLVPDSYYFCFKGFRSGWFAGDIPPWSEKATRFLWRGSTTGGGELTRETLALAPRFRLCELGKSMGPIADFAFTAVIQREPHGADIKLILQDKDMLRETMPQHVMSATKFLIEIDGNANSWGFFAKLLMGCCVLKVGSPFEQWFYDRLEPWVHYVPVAQDLSDLSDRMDWCLRHQETAQKIAEAGRKIAESMSFESEMAAAANTLLSAACAYD